METVGTTSSNILQHLIVVLVLLVILSYIVLKIAMFCRRFCTRPLLETKISDVLAFRKLVGEGQDTILLKSNIFARVIEVEGLDYSNVSMDKLNSLNVARHNFFTRLENKEASFKIIASKYKVKEEFKEQENNNKLLGDIFKEVKKSVENTYTLKYYIFLYDSTLDDLDNLTTEVLSLFTEFKPSLIMGHALIKFLYFHVNHNSFQQIANDPEDLHYGCSASSHSFIKKTVKIENINKNTFDDETIYAGIFSINKYGQRADSDLINKFLSLKMKLEVVINAKLHENTKAKFKLSQWNKYGRLNYFKNRIREQEFSEVDELIDSQREALVNVEVNFIYYAKSKEELLANKKEILRELSSFGINLVEENEVLELAYFNRFLGFFQPLNLRPIITSNLTHLIDFSNNDLGLRFCDWGKYPVAYLKNSTGGLYKLFLHASDNEGETTVAHTVSVAPTGSGKTFLFEHIISGVLYFYKNVNVYCFDSNQGLKVFTNSVGGEYLDIKSNDLNLNPLLMDLEDSENRNFLVEWFKIISLLEDAESEKEFNTAVEILRMKPLEKRKNLASMKETLFGKNLKILNALEPFLDGNNASLFNGATDSLSLDGNRMFCFDMTNILKDGKASAGFLSYIMFKIRKHAKETTTPHLVFIDETSSMLQNVNFRKYIEIMLKEHRKLRGSINVVFQNIKDMVDLGVLELINNQCPTKFLFKNVEADKDLYINQMGLKEAQVDVLKGNTLLPINRLLLVKKHGKVALLDIDLKEELGDLTKFYNSSIDAVKFLADLQKNEANWFDIFKNTNLKDLEEVRNKRDDLRKSSLYKVFKDIT